jgi:hypothetical protein
MCGVRRGRLPRPAAGRRDETRASRDSWRRASAAGHGRQACMCSAERVPLAAAAGRGRGRGRGGRAVRHLAFSPPEMLDSLCKQRGQAWPGLRSNGGPARGAGRGAIPTAARRASRCQVHASTAPASRVSLRDCVAVTMAHSSPGRRTGTSGPLDASLAAAGIVMRASRGRSGARQAGGALFTPQMWQEDTRRAPARRVAMVQNGECRPVSRQPAPPPTPAAWMPESNAQPCATSMATPPRSSIRTGAGRWWLSG